MDLSLSKIRDFGFHKSSGTMSTGLSQNPELESKGVAAANFARDSEPVLNREGSNVYGKDKSIVSSLNTGDVASAR